MSLINFNDLPVNDSGNSTVSFFTLKDGEEAIVRILIDSVSDFPIFQVHQLEVNGKRRSINCLRDIKDSAEKCPLCSSGASIKQSFYIPMLHYVTNSNNQIEVKPVIWTDRSVSMARTIKGYLDNYGPLSDIICKITRKGSGLNTEWNILPNLNPQIYRNDIYIKDTSAFDNYKILGGIIMDKSFNDLQTFINTGNFPEGTSDNTMSTSNMTTSQNIATEPIFESNTNPFPQDEIRMPWENNTSNNIQRPSRTF